MLSKKAAPKQGMYPGEDKPRILPEKKIDTTVVYEKKVEIVDSQSRQSLAHGIAYMNKNGQIVKIKVKR
ncbi:MAG: hypothetical protein HUK40_10850 [Desulfobacter sp.]|nr:hypothetical protein [Desulfobacter sp.]